MFRATIQGLNRPTHSDYNFPRWPTERRGTFQTMEATAPVQAGNELLRLRNESIELTSKSLKQEQIVQRTEQAKQVSRELIRQRILENAGLPQSTCAQDCMISVQESGQMELGIAIDTLEFLNPECYALRQANEQAKIQLQDLEKQYREVSERIQSIVATTPAHNKNIIAATVLCGM